MNAKIIRLTVQPLETFENSAYIFVVRNQFDLDFFKENFNVVDTEMIKEAMEKLKDGEAVFLEVRYDEESIAS